MALFGKARKGFPEDRDLARQGSNSGPLVSLIYCSYIRQNVTASSRPSPADTGSAIFTIASYSAEGLPTQGERQAFLFLFLQVSRE
jgi:hypothetical protein